jgi:hypothetical protein
MSNKQYVGKTFAGAINQSPTTRLNNLPTTTVRRSGTVSADSIAAINIIGGLQAVIDVTTLVTGQSLLLVATGGVAATVQLSNGATVAGSTSYILKPGNFLSVYFDGTNLVCE